MPKVLRILNRFNVGGPTHNATFLTKYLSPDFKTKLIAGNKLDSEEASEYILENANIDYYIIKNMGRSINPINDIKAFLEIVRIIRNYKPDIVHTHASKSGALGRLAAIYMGVPLIFHTFHGHVFHSYFGKLKTYIYILIERYLARKSNQIIAISDIQKKDLVEKYKISSDKKVTVIPLGFDLEKFNQDSQKKRADFRKEFSLLDDQIAIGIIGRLTAIKNHKLFLYAIKEVVSRADKCISVFIIGDGEEKEKLIELTKDLGLSYSTINKKNIDATVHFTSWRSDMDTVYAGLDIVGLSSLNEGTPVTLIEAQASKKPIVSTDVGGIKDIVQHNETALLSQSGDYNQMAENILRLISDADFRRKMGRNGKKNVEDRFSYKRLVNDVRNLYNRFI